MLYAGIKVVYATIQRYVLNRQVYDKINENEPG